MQHKQILDTLSKEDVVSINALIDTLQVSSRTVRSILSDLRNDGMKSGFEIETIRNEGYRLKITDPELFSSYRQAGADYFGNVQSRLPRILYFLLQQNDFITTQKLADLLVVSKNTMIRDLERLSIYLENRDLCLHSQSGLGIKIEGSEHELRKIFSQYVVNSQGYISMTKGYFEFSESLDMSEISLILKNEMETRGLQVSNMSFDSIIDHLRVLLYRIGEGNLISEMEQGSQKIDQIYIEIAESIADWISDQYDFRIPLIEIEYLASQIAGKSSAELIPEFRKMALKKEVIRILGVIDLEYLTGFQQDSDLVDALLMHMYPLLTRIAHKIELNNPLVEYVSSRYANVFLVALKFVELWNENEVADLSRDEVGYLALHFASHLERLKAESLNKINKILILSNIGRGNAVLIKQKIKNVFKGALITIDNNPDIDSLNNSGAELILSTLSLDETHLKIPLIYIKEMINDDDISEIKDLVVLRTQTLKSVSKVNIFKDLFDSQLFEITESDSYLEVIEEKAKQMVDLNFASEDFPSLVLKREEKFSTIYENGVAGPHSMELNAIKEKVAIIIPKGRMIHQGKKINIIFLINIKKGDLFLYRLVSKMLQSLIDDTGLEKNIKNIKSYEDFIRIFDNKYNRLGE